MLVTFKKRRVYFTCRHFRFSALIQVYWPEGFSSVSPSSAQKTDSSRKRSVAEKITLEQFSRGGRRFRASSPSNHSSITPNQPELSKRAVSFAFPYSSS